MNRSRDRSRSGAASLLAQATAQLGGIAPYHWWDFIANRALFASADVGGVASTPGWSYTRADAQTAYAQDSAGNLIPFATGVLRRTDKGVLIEGARTNLCLRSQEFDNASWTKTRCSATANAITAPDGTLTADKLTEDTSNNSHQALQTITVASGVMTATIYFKAAERTFAQVSMSDNATGTAQCVFNLSNGAMGTPSVNGSWTSVSAAISTLANGWYRCSVAATRGAGTETVIIAGLATAIATTSYMGDGTSGVYLWGAQLEAASFPSSYIPTTTASATRAADVLTVSSPGVSYPLSLFAEFERGQDTGAQEKIFGVDAGATNERSRLDVDTSDRGNIFVSAGGATQANDPVAGALAAGTVYKLAARIATNDVKAARSGTLSTGDATVTLPSTPTLIRFGVDVGGGPELNGYLRKTAIFNSAVNDAGLQSMTL